MEAPETWWYLIHASFPLFKYSGCQCRSTPLFRFPARTHRTGRHRRNCLTGKEPTQLWRLTLPPDVVPTVNVIMGRPAEIRTQHWGIRPAAARARVQESIHVGRSATKG